MTWKSVTVKVMTHSHDSHDKQCRTLPPQQASCLFKTFSRSSHALRLWWGQVVIARWNVTQEFIFFPTWQVLTLGVVAYPYSPLLVRRSGLLLSKKSLRGAARGWNWRIQMSWDSCVLPEQLAWNWRKSKLVVSGARIAYGLAPVCFSSL